MVARLGLEKKYWFTHRRLWWYRPLGLTRGGQIPFFNNTLIDSFLYAVRLNIDRFVRKKTSLTQSCVIHSISKRRTQSPLEIQFKDNVCMMYK